MTGGRLIHVAVQTRVVPAHTVQGAAQLTDLPTVIEVVGASRGEGVVSSCSSRFAIDGGKGRSELERIRVG